MRRYALSGLAALAISIMTPSLVWAWSTEQATPGTGTTTNLADPDETLKALQDKVDAKGLGSTQSGFFVSGGVNQGPVSPFGFRSNPTGTAVPFGYNPNPGFRGQSD
jgi:hypothetical protein